MIYNWMNHLLIFENFIKETYAPNKDFPQEVPRDMPYTTDMQRTPEDYGVFVDKLIYSDNNTRNDSNGINNVYQTQTVPTTWG